MTGEEQFVFIVMSLIGAFCSLVYLITNICFIVSLQKTLRLIPKHCQSFPRWFCWLTLIPIVGFVFSWIMLPFGIPDAIKNSQTDNSEALICAKRLFGLGLAMMILSSLSLLLYHIFLLTCLPMLVLWIIYWVDIVSIRKVLKPSEE